MWKKKKKAEDEKDLIKFLEFYFGALLIFFVVFLYSLRNTFLLSSSIFFW